MLPTIAIVLIIFWALGFGFHIAGGLIHIILVVALIMFVLHLSESVKHVNLHGGTANSAKLICHHVRRGEKAFFGFRVWQKEADAHARNMNPSAKSM
jgi:uncharacterized protein (DUF58 family)